MKRNAHRIPRLRTCFLILALALFSSLPVWRFVLPAVHRHFGVCPLTFSKFSASDSIPVVYGYPMQQTLAEAAKGRLVVGGCIVGSTVAVCPHCHVGVKFRDWDAELMAMQLPAD